MADDAPECSPQQKLSIATYFLLSSPTGEIEDVLTDVKKLVSDPSVLTEDALTKILATYNTEQLTTSVDPDGKPVMVSSYGQVSQDLFLDPSTSRVLRFDHRRRKVTEVTEQKQVLRDDIARYRTSIATSLGSYIEANYKEGKCVLAVYGADNGIITVCISAKNVHLGNFWSGGWRSVFSFNVAKAGSVEMKGNIKVNVHYFEEGNVQLHTHVDKTVNVTITSDEEATGKNVAVAIAQVESEFQSNLEEMYVNMHRTTFKAMRRFLPVSRQPMVWNLAAHSIAGEVQDKEGDKKPK
jgi:capping protein alpha